MPSAMSTMGLLFVFMALVSPMASARRQTTTGQANPIRKVVTMLQAMQQKVMEEGEKEKDLYEKFMCYCSTGTKELSASIGAAETKIPALGKDIEEAEASLAQLKADLAAATASRAAAKEAMASATAMREKEAAAYAAEKADYDANVAAIAKAVAALEKGMGGSFLQTNGAQVLKQLASKQDMMESDRQLLTSFLSGSQSTGYAPQSGQITGILKQMGDEMSKGLSETMAAEAAAIATYEKLMAAKTKEVEALQASIESKMTRIGETSVSIATMKEDLTDTEEALLEDQKFLAGLEEGCKTKTKEWEERSKTRADELVALADTIKILNDDDALELFKKTLPSASSSFVQLGATRSAVRQRALSLLRRVQKAAFRDQPARLDFLVLALSGEKAASQGTFDKVIAMIDEMVAQLKKEQEEDDDKKEYCATQFDLSDDKKKALERKVSDLTAAIEETKDLIASLAEEIATLEKTIKDLDTSVAEATDLRKSENADFKDLMASDSAAKELLGFAKNRLNKFYNPKLYKPPAKRELSTGDRVYENMGGDIATTTPGGIAGTGVTVFAQIRAHSHRVAPAPPPGTWGTYKKAGEETNGVMAMINLLVQDLDKEMSEATQAEKDAQADYKTMMADAAEKRAADSKSLTEKGSAKAQAEGALDDHTDAKADTGKELMATLKYIQSLHTECDFLLKYFDARKESRAGEIDSLGKAKAVLSGADFSFIQTERSSPLRSA